MLKPLRRYQITSIFILSSIIPQKLHNYVGGQLADDEPKDDKYEVQLPNSHFEALNPKNVYTHKHTTQYLKALKTLRDKNARAVKRCGSSVEFK